MTYTGRGLATLYAMTVTVAIVWAWCIYLRTGDGFSAIPVFLISLPLSLSLLPAQKLLLAISPQGQLLWATACGLLQALFPFWLSRLVQRRRARSAHG